MRPWNDDWIVNDPIVVFVLRPTITNMFGDIMNMYQLFPQDSETRHLKDAIGEIQMRRKMSREEQERVDATIEAMDNREYSDSDVEKVLDNEEKIKKLFSMGPLKEFSEYVPLMLNLVKDYKAKRYKTIPVKSIVAIVATLLYVILPTDVIPDIVPALGFTDDAAVVMWCLKVVKSDLDKYKEWKEASLEAEFSTDVETLLKN